MAHDRQGFSPVIFEKKYIFSSPILFQISYVEQRFVKNHLDAALSSRDRYL
jgi:hypothetical protein